MALTPRSLRINITHYPPIMKLSAFKTILSQLDEISFQLPTGELVPRHFHVTEVGKVTKHFVDCGGVERLETVVNFQLWEANDYDHRLHPEKLLSIIELSEKKLGIGDLEIEVEYQGRTIGKYALDYRAGSFQLVSTATACLAIDACNIPTVSQGIEPLPLASTSCCGPSGTCC